MFKINNNFILTIFLICSLLIIILVAVLVFQPFSQESKLVKELTQAQLISETDADNDGLDDYSDIVQNARAQIDVVTLYDTSYYVGGYPPENSGVCADVIWRALQGAGYDFKKMIDDDMLAYPERYTNDYDTNINFRRTQNIRIFLENNVQTLPTEVIPNNYDNLVTWQGGDIVTFAQIPGGLWHVAIVSDRRRADGVPYLIHNHGYGTLENDYLLRWPTEITGHFRFMLK